jgi:signal recognition particle subunit SEC65
MDGREIARRFAYHPPSTDEVIKAHEQVRRECAALAESLNALLPDGREKAKAMNRLDEVAMYANASIARTQLGGAPT